MAKLIKIFFERFSNFEVIFFALLVHSSFAIWCALDRDVLTTDFYCPDRRQQSIDRATASFKAIGRMPIEESRGWHRRHLQCQISENRCTVWKPNTPFRPKSHIYVIRIRITHSTYFELFKWPYSWLSNDFHPRTSRQFNLLVYRTLGAKCTAEDKWHFV